MHNYNRIFGIVKGANKKSRPADCRTGRFYGDNKTAENDPALL